MAQLVMRQKKRNNNLNKQKKSECELMRLKNVAPNEARFSALGLMPPSSSFKVNANESAQHKQKRRQPKRKKEKSLETVTPACKHPTRSSSRLLRKKVMCYE